MKRRSAFIATGRGYRLFVRADFPGGWSAKSVMVLCHGLGTTHATTLIALMREALLATGHAVVCFDFAGHGKSGTSMQKRLVRNFAADIGSVREWLTAQEGDHQLVIVGHSIGALAALIYAARNSKGVRGIALIGCNAAAKNKFHQLQRQGKLRKYARYWVVGSTKVAKQFWNDRARYEPQLFARRLTVPTLLICGAEDVTNPPSDSRQLYRWIKARKKLVLVPNTDHYFRTQVSRRAAARAVLAWFKN